MSIKAIFSKIKENDKTCPFCGEKSIRYGKKLKCWSLTEERCPECSAMIKYQTKIPHN